jgi:hypothetical protein
MTFKHWQELNKPLADKVQNFEGLMKAFEALGLATDSVRSFYSPSQIVTYLSEWLNRQVFETDLSRFQSNAGAAVSAVYQWTTAYLPGVANIASASAFLPGLCSIARLFDDSLLLAAESPSDDWDEAPEEHRSPRGLARYYISHGSLRRDTAGCSDAVVVKQLLSAFSSLEEQARTGAKLGGPKAFRLFVPQCDLFYLDEETGDVIYPDEALERLQSQAFSDCPPVRKIDPKPILLATLRVPSSGIWPPKDIAKTPPGPSMG